MAGMTARTMVAGGVAGLGLALGGLAVATADDTDAPGPDRAYGAPAAPDDRGPGGMRGGPDGGWDDGPGGGERAADLAEELGVTEQEVRDAWEAVRDDLRPERGERGDGPPSEEDREALQDEVAAALAAELDLPVADVEAALEEVREAAVEGFRTEARARLVERLDDAVADGDLTAADKASVLKAFDAGVLGGGPGGLGLGGHGPR